MASFLLLPTSSSAFGVRTHDIYIVETNKRQRVKNKQTNKLTNRKFPFFFFGESCSYACATEVLAGGVRMSRWWFFHISGMGSEGKSRKKERKKETRTTTK